MTGCKKLQGVKKGAKENLASILTLAKSVSLVTRSDGVHRLRAKAKERKTRGGRKEKCIGRQHAKSRGNKCQQNQVHFERVKDRTRG